MITAMLSLVVSILDLIRVITKYCFPENDEEYIVKIVESIQNNDLEKFKEINRSAEAREKNTNADWIEYFWFFEQKTEVSLQR